MAYVPPATIAQAFDAADADWTQVIDNHGNVQELYAPPIIDQYLSFTTTATSYADRVVWRVRDNHALHDVRTRVRARTTVGNGTLKVTNGAASGNVAVTGAWAWYEVDVTPPAADGDFALATKVAVGGDSMEVGAIQVYLVPTVATDVTGWVDVDSSTWGASDTQVPSRVVEDLLNGIILVARDRPMCMTGRVSDLSVSVSGKPGVVDAWGSFNTTLWQTVGRLIRPYPISVPSMRIDAYVTRSSGTATVEIGVGPTSWQFDAAADGWYSTVIVGPDDIAEVTAALIPGGAASAAIRTIQIWRGG